MTERWRDDGWVRLTLVPSVAESAQFGAPEGARLCPQWNQKLAEYMRDEIVFTTESSNGATFCLLVPGP